VEWKHLPLRIRAADDFVKDVQEAVDATGGERSRVPAAPKIRRVTVYPKQQHRQTSWDACESRCLGVFVTRMMVADTCTELAGKCAY
jgi:hypothetical protein